jgi:hypothetical protein
MPAAKNLHPSRPDNREVSATITAAGSGTRAAERLGLRKTLFAEMTGD